MEKCLRCKSENYVLQSEHEFHNIYKCIDCDYLTPTITEDCCRNPFLNVTIDNKNPDRPRLHRQCLNCGGCIDRKSPLASKKYSSEIRFEFSYFNYDKWLTERKSEVVNLWESVKRINFESSKYGKYSSYLGTEEWKLKRNEALKRDENLCQVCKINEAVEVHHITYENFSNEKLEDLLSVCKDCHIEIHRKIDVEKRIKILNEFNKRK